MKSIRFFLLAVVAFLAVALCEADAFAQISVWSTVSGGNGHAYEFVNDSVWWDEARVASQARTPPSGFLPGTLVSIGSATENTFVNSLRVGTSPWIGFTDESIEGEWRWIDDTPGIWQDPSIFPSPVQTAYTNWSAGEPNNASDEDYGLFWDYAFWNDGQLRGTRMPYIVEYKPTSTLSPTTSWTVWSSNTAGAIATPTGNVSVAYSGELNGFDAPSWNPPSTYADGLNVTDPPPVGGNAVRLFGGDNSLKSVTFSEPVVNPVLAIWSLGTAGREASFVFNQTPTLISGGPSAECGGGTLNISGNTVFGSEAAGTVMFPGSYSQLSWTNPQYEGWYAFTIGISNVVITNLKINVGNGTQTQAQAGYAIISGTLPVIKLGTGTLVLGAANTHTGSTTVQQGTLQIGHASALSSSPVSVESGGTLSVNTAGTMQAPSLTLTGGQAILPVATHQIVSLGSLSINHSAGGKLDIGKGRIEIAPGGISEADLRAALIAGRTAAGTFSGTSGIVTSAANPRPFFVPVVGYNVLPSGATVVAWSAFGDLNLDGTVDFDDVLQMVSASKYDTGSPATWADGDFDYNGVVDFDDVLAFTGSRLFDRGSYLPAPLAPSGMAAFSGESLGVAAVPEPSTWAMGVLGLFCASWRVWRRRRSAGIAWSVRSTRRHSARMGRAIAKASIGLIAASCENVFAVSYSVPGSTATVTPSVYSPVTTDLFDLNQGMTLLSDSGYTYAGAGPYNMFGGQGGVNGDLNNTLFADGNPAGTVHFATFSLSSPITIGVLRIGLSQDGWMTRRGTAGYSLLGLQSPTDTGVVLSQATLASDYVVAYGSANITVEDAFPAFTGRFFRFNVVQGGDYFGPRVQEVDGFAPKTDITLTISLGATQTQAAVGYAFLDAATATSVTKSGLGTVVFNAANTYTGPTSIKQGTLLVTNSAAIQATPVTVEPGATVRINTAGTMQAPGLTLAGSSQLILPTATHQVVSLGWLSVDQTAGGRIDIGKGRIEIAPGGITEADLRADLLAGRGVGTFSSANPGIVTSAANPSPLMAPVIGYNFLPSGAAIVAWSAFGDMNLDGSVDFDDVVQFVAANRYDTGLPATWAHGDFDYNGVVDFDDVVAFTGSRLYDKGSYLPGPGGMAAMGIGAAMAVPEPSAFALASAGVGGCVGFSMWRRRNRA